jgi:MFS family permease
MRGGWLPRLIAGHIFLHSSMVAMRMATPLLALRLGHSAWHVGVLLALFSISQVFLSIPAGRYADRHGLHRPMRLAVCAAMVGAALSLRWPVFAMLCVSALCMGAATGMASVALQRHVGRAARDNVELRRVFSWLAIGPAVSNFFGAVAAGVLIDYGALAMPEGLSQPGFRAAFLFALGMPLLCAWCIRGVPELAPVAPSTGPQASAWYLLQSPPMRRLLMVNWLLSSCWDVHTFVVPVLGHERALSASVIGTILGGFAVAAVGVRLLIPLAAAQVKEWHALTASMVLTAGVFMVYPLMHSAWGMGVCSVILGVALGAVQPMIMSTLHQITPHAQHGQAIGLRLTTINFSSVVMPLLFGSAGAVVGVSVVFWSVGALVALGARSAWRLRT